MFIDHKEDQNEEHHEVATSCQSLEIAHSQGDIAALFFVLFNGCEVAALLIYIF